MIKSLTDEPGAIATAAAIAAGKFSPLEAVDAAIARIEALDGPINAVVVRDFDRARELARSLDGMQPGADQKLFGVPMTVKESFNVAGLPTTFGHLQFKDNIAQVDSRVVQLLKRAGAIIVGKTNVPPDLADLQSDNPVYGRTNNPRALDRVAGGSSGGSAAALAAGMVAAEYGSDIGSSIRNPAHFNGVFGHKTTFGLVSKRGHTHPMAGPQDVHDSPLSVTGPLARNAEDLALLLQVTAERPLSRSGQELGEMRFLAITEHPVSEIDEAVRQPIEAALRAIEASGARVERTSDLIPDLTAQHVAYMRLMRAVMSRGQAGLDGHVTSLSEYFELLDDQARNRFAWSGLFEQFDFVLAPPLPFVAYHHDATPLLQRRITINGKDSAFADALAWAGLATFPNLPSTVVPVGETNGLPCGMQVIGREWADLDCIDTAGMIAKILSN